MNFLRKTYRFRQNADGAEGVPTRGPIGVRGAKPPPIGFAPKLSLIANLILSHSLNLILSLSLQGIARSPLWKS